MPYQYNTWFLDCDGVILDSNKAKENAFYETVIEFGEKNASSFMSHVKKSRGISRFKQIRFFVESILKIEDKNVTDTLVDVLVDKYATMSYEAMMDSPLTEGCIEFLHRTSLKSDLYIISGTYEKEIIDVFNKRDIMKYVRGCFGSPRTKVEIMSSIAYEGPAVFVGDSAFDSASAKAMAMDFIFINGYTDTLLKDLHVNPIASASSFEDIN